MIRGQRRFFIKEIETAKIYDKATGKLVGNLVGLKSLPIGQWEEKLEDGTKLTYMEDKLIKIELPLDTD